MNDIVTLKDKENKLLDTILDVAERLFPSVTEMSAPSVVRYMTKFGKEKSTLVSNLIRDRMPGDTGVDYDKYRRYFEVQVARCGEDPAFIPKYFTWVAKVEIREVSSEGHLTIYTSLSLLELPM